MFYINQKEQIINPGRILCFTLSFFLIVPIVIRIGTSFKPAGEYCSGIITDVVIRRTVDRAEFGMADAAEITCRALWDTTGPSDDVPLNRPQGCCLDLDFSRVYVADTDNDRVMVFTTDGEAIGPFLTSRPLNRPFDLVIGPSGRMYISQIGKEAVEVFDNKGLWEASIPKEPKEKGLNFAPGRMAFDHQGRLMVIDRSTGLVWIMSKEGKVLKKLSVPQKEKKIALLTGLAVGPDKNIYVASAQSIPVISIMNPEGAHLLSFGRHGALYKDSFSFPSSLTVDDKGRIWVVDAFRHTVKVFSSDGQYLFHIGKFGRGPGMFVYPVDIDIDKEGRLYVLEKGAGRLQALIPMAKEVE